MARVKGNSTNSSPEKGYSSEEMDHMCGVIAAALPLPIRQDLWRWSDELIQGVEQFSPYANPVRFCRTSHPALQLALVLGALAGESPRMPHGERWTSMNGPRYEVRSGSVLLFACHAPSTALAMAKHYSDPGITVDLVGGETIVTQSTAIRSSTSDI